MRNRFVLSAVVPLLVAVNSSQLCAQGAGPTPPDDNPTANTGALKAQIQTAGSYDAHSGNATRSITDLHIPDAVGVYGLDFTRYYNSLRNDRNSGNQYRNPAPVPNQPTDFGSPGWTHSWAWDVDYEEYTQHDDVNNTQSISTYYTSITITFPDGHATKYTISRVDPAPPTQPWPADGRSGPPYYSAHGETHWPASGDVDDFLDDMAQDGSSFWLHRADGGSVHFVNTNWGYQAQEVYDPHGLLTTLHYDINGNLDWVVQDGGRRLNLTWGLTCKPGQPTLCSRVIGRVENAGSAGLQAVEYHYDWLGNWPILTYAFYQNDPVLNQTVTASYTYQEYVPPQGFFYAGPLLVTADDPRFAGAMRQIKYSYRGSGCQPNPTPTPGYQDGQLDYFFASPTSIAAEKSWRVDSNGIPFALSTFTLGCFDGTRSESNGLGGFRKFFYGRSAGPKGTYHCLGYQLAKVTNYTTQYPLPAGLAFERQNYLGGHPRQIWDGRDIETDLIHADGSGLPNEVRHAGSDGSAYLYDRVNPGGSAQPDTTRIHNPYHHWLFKKTDERVQSTTYTRDSRRRITHIAYHDGSGEDFTYDSLTNQITTHTLASGVVQHYDYNSAHQLEREWNSWDGPGEATTYTYYGPGSHPEWTGLVATSLNPRAASWGATYSAKMEYNGRQQVTKVYYPSTGGNPTPSVIYGYDNNGNCTSITDEMGHTSFYTYDDYGRCTSYTEPLNAMNWNGSGIEPSRRWDWFYDRVIDGVGYRDSYTHTKNEWRVQMEPAFNGAGGRRATARTHDLQNRIIKEETGWIILTSGAWVQSADWEAHSFEYDANGQKNKYTDPRLRITTYDYDLRNRLWKTNETVNSVPRTTETLYDWAGNKTDVIFPDTKSQHWQDYDPFGQAWTFIDERTNRTDLSYCWGPMKKLCTVTTYRLKDDGSTIENQPTIFWSDPMGRLTRTDFPDGTREESFYKYGQVETWKTRKGQIKTIVYDARGRELSNSWASDAAPAISRSWDDANRLTSITNMFSSIDFAYDEAGQVIWEGDEIAGSGGRTQTNYYRYPDGSVAHLHYPGGAYIRKDYTARGQLAATGWDDDENNWWKKLAAYTYLPDGEVGQVDYGNGMRTGLAYDDRGFAQVVDHYRPGIQDYSWRQYWRDNRDRITAFQKNYNPGSNPLENYRGDRFRYDDEGQLVEAWYNATDPANSGVNNTRYDEFGYDALGNRTQNNYVASRGQTSFVRRDNGLNQYSSWTPSVIYHDDNYPGWSPPGNGVAMTDGWITASYNALNQPVAVWSFAYQGTSNFLWFGYDPLGRCVKRWVGDSGNIYSNPATYFHYDGWDLLQEGANAWGPARVYANGNQVDEIVWSYNTFTGEQAFHHYDARGHCTLLTDSTGNILEQYEYDAFGQPYFYDSLGNSTLYSAFGNRFLFTGREWLADVRLYDYRNRMYQPELGRFMQPDPKHFTAGDYNLYRYCHNDPVNKTDPLGLAPGDPFDAPQDAARDVHNFINPTSIRENAEYGSIIYRGGDGRFYASRPFSDGAGTRVNVGAPTDQSRVPEGGNRVGDYHSHGDYSIQGPKDPTTGKPIPQRVTGPNAKRDDAMRGYNSGHASSSDKERSANAVKQNPNYRTFLGTPSKEFKEYDKKKDWRP